MQSNLVDLVEKFEWTFQARVNHLSACNHVEVTPFQAKVLLLVSRHVDCSQQAIADWISRDKAQVARTVKELESSGLIKRTPIKLNGRVLKLRLTNNGKIVCGKLDLIRRETVEDMFSVMAPHERHTLTNLLTKLLIGLTANAPHLELEPCRDDELEPLVHA